MLDLDYYDNLKCDQMEKANLKEWSIVNEGSDIDTVDDIIRFMKSQGCKTRENRYDLFKSYTDVELLNQFQGLNKFQDYVFYHQDDEFVLEALAEIRTDLGA